MTQQAEEMKNNTEMLEVKQIEGAPFSAVRFDDKWFLALGKYRLTEPLENEEACIEAAKDASWERIMQVVQIMIENYKEKEEKNV